MTHTILVAGASGYIGRALISRLRSKFPSSRIIGLSRGASPSAQSEADWISCDLFSVESLQSALPTKIDVAYYLVHSMGSTARLDQGSFADYDLILADNFARVLKTRQVGRLIYLGGLVPEGSLLSEHLRSRREVEEVFQGYGLAPTCFRAGLILGEQGSSSQILLKLVRRLPLMVCPSWTQTLTTPVELTRVIEALASAPRDPANIGKTYDLAGCAPITYIEMMKQTAKQLGLRRYFLRVPFFSPTLSKLWVRLISNSPKGLVYPLVESLEHPMVARKDFVFGGPQTLEPSYSEMLKHISLGALSARKIYRAGTTRNTVRSVQRLPLPAGATALDVVQIYGQWLTDTLKPLVRVHFSSPWMIFFLLFRDWSLLRLRLRPELSDNTRQTLQIVDGLLVSKTNQGVFEFRIVLNGRFVLAAIHDYHPSLPWYVYRMTQAPLHLIVMKVFGWHLKRR